ncbi:MAG: element excision factor XisH family protein, partial [Saprospiraceae bacterium]
MQKDKYHQEVREALEKEGWTITHDPLVISIGTTRGYIDLAAERPLIAAQRGTEKIAVEIKSFLGLSPVDDFEDALGKFRLYLGVLEEIEPDRTLYLAVPKHFFNKFFEQAIFLKIAKKNDLKMIVYDFNNSTIEKWIN